MRWQRRARLIIAIFGLLLAGTVVYVIRPRDLRTPPPTIATTPEARVETTGGNVVQVKGTRQDLRVEFASQVTYADGRTALQGVKLMVDNREGRNFVITGKEARVGRDNSSYEMTGDVKLVASDGLVATGNAASFTDAEGIVRVPGPVQFTRGRMAGAGVGFTYDEQRNTVWLLDQAVVRFAAEGELPPMDVAAGAAGFARGDRYLRFERGVRMNRAGQLIEATEATVHLFADRDEPDRIELRGDSRITGGENMGSLRLLSARDINLDYADDGRTLQQATMAGRGTVHMAGRNNGPGQQLNGEWIDVSLAPDGAVTGLSGRDAVNVVLPANGDTPSRTVRSTAMSGRGAPGEGLSAMRFEDAVEFREAATRERPARIARAHALDLQLKPSSGDLEEARFTGAFRFEEGALTGASAEARYQIGDGLLALTGLDGGRPPHIADDRLTIDAERIDVTLSPRRMRASGKVGTVLLPAREGTPAAEGTRRPALLADREPVIVSADKLDYAEDTRRGVYTGQARLFQGETSIRANEITLDESRGDLVATGSVLTTLKLTPRDPGIKTPPTIARGATFRYGDDTRRAAYDTGAQMDGEQGTIRADRIELYLEKAENRLERLEAAGTVSVTIEKRKATGVKLTYRPADEEYLMVGSPVQLVEECQETSGRTMRFFRSSERVQVDGNDQQRTQAKGGTCPK
jgi:lipopolysaccharide export system protein LptA